MKKKLIVILIALVAMIPVTVSAWYVLSRNAGVNMFGGKISQWDLIVSDTPGGKPIGDGELVNLNFKEYSNINANVMAPGTSGTIDLYIRTNSDVFSQYAIYLDESQLCLGDDFEIIQKHFKFYMDEALTKEINLENPMIGEVAPNKEVKATIYWCWVYDGSDDIPKNLTKQEDIAEFLLEWDKEDCYISDNRELLGGELQIYVNAYQQEPK